MGSQSELRVFQGSWQSEEGDHVAKIEGFEIRWPDGSSKPLTLDETDEGRFTFELDDQVFGARLTSEDRLEFTDGDVWLRSQEPEKPKPKRRSAPRKPPVPLDGTEPIKPKRKAAPRKRAPPEEKAKKYKVTSQNKVGILSKPEIEAEVRTYLMPGAIFMAEEEWVDPRDERKYFFITTEHGWVPQCSRKDPSKVVVEEQISKQKKARLEAEQAAAAAAAQAAREAEVPAERLEDQPQDAKAEEAPNLEQPAPKQDGGAPKGHGRARTKATPAAPISKEELEDKVFQEVEDIEVDPEMQKIVEGMALEGEVPEASCEQCCRLMKLPVPKLKAMLKSVWLPAEGPQQRLAVRLVRFLADLGPCGADVALFQAAGVPTSPPTRRLRGKHKAPPAPAPSQPPAPVKSYQLWGMKPRPGRASRPVARPRQKVQKVPTVEDLVDSGEIPEEHAERYEALSGAKRPELEEMADSLSLSKQGTSAQLAFRIVRLLAGLPPISDAALGAAPKAPARKAAAKPKLRAGKLGGASRIRQPAKGRSRGRGGRSRGIAPRVRRAPPPPKLRVPKPDPGPSKAKLREFLINFLSSADVESTTIRQLKEAAKEQFDELNEQAISNLRDLAAVEMRKQLTARARKKARTQPVEQEPADEEPGQGQEQDGGNKPTNTEEVELESLSAPAVAPVLSEAAPAEGHPPELPAQDQDKNLPEDSDSDSCSISPFDMALLGSPAPAGLRSPGPSGLRSPAPATPKLPRGSPKVDSRKVAKKATEASGSPGGEDPAAPELTFAKKPRQAKAKHRVKEVKAPVPKVKKDLPPKAPSKPASTEERKTHVEEKRSQNSFVFVSSGTGEKLEDNIDDDEQLMKLAELRQKEAAERKKRSMEMIVFDGIQTTLARFVQHSIVHSEKHAALLETGYLNCKIRVPAAVWSSDLESRLRTFVSSFGGELSEDKSKDKPEKPDKSEKVEKVRALRAKLAKAKAQAELEEETTQQADAGETDGQKLAVGGEAAEAQKPSSAAEADAGVADGHAEKVEGQAAEEEEAPATEGQSKEDAQEQEHQQQNLAEQVESKEEQAAEEAKEKVLADEEKEVAEGKAAEEPAQEGHGMPEAKAEDPETAASEEKQADLEPKAQPEGVSQDQEKSEAAASQEVAGVMAEILSQGDTSGTIPMTPAPIPGTPVFAGLTKTPGREASAGVAAAGQAVQRAYSGPVSKWLISLTASALEHYVFKHPQVVDMTDSKLWKFTESFAAKADLHAVKISAFMSSLERRFGEQLVERKSRTIRILTVCLKKKMQPQRAEEAPEDPEKGKAKPKAKAGTKSMNAQKERKMIEPPTKSKKKALAPDEDPESIYIQDKQDLMWAVRVLAPFGLSKASELVVKPPVSQALPLMKSLRVLSSWPSLKQILQETKIGRVVNGLRRHPDSEVAALARELMESWKETCQIQLKQKPVVEALQAPPAVTSEGAEEPALPLSSYSGGC